MKYCFVLLLLITPFKNLIAAPVAALNLPLVAHALLLDIDLINQRTLVAVGEYGHILLSNDAENWQQAKVPVQSTLTAVFFIDENIGWAVGHDAVILNTIDGGENWQIQQYLPELEKPLLDIAFRDRQHGIAVGAYGLFYRTLDGGKTWQQEFHDELLSDDDKDYLNDLKFKDEEAYLDEKQSILAHFNRLEIDGVTTYLTGEAGLIAKSNDFGKTWLPFNNIYQGSFFDIARTNKANLLLVGLRGHVFRSLKNGTPWKEVKTNTTALLNSIVLAQDEHLFVLGNNGTLLESKDDGQSFILRKSTDSKAYIDGVWFENQLVIATDAGIKRIRF